MSDVKSVVLQTCPFCGGANLKARTEDIDGWIAHIECRDCDDMTGPMSEFKYPTVDEAIEDAAHVWNRRASPASPPAEALPSQTSGVEAIAAAILADVQELPLLNHPTAGAVYCANSVEDTIIGPTRRRLALAKPASEPAGGGVREALQKLYDGGVACHDLWFFRELKEIMAALSSPASSSPAEAEALQAGVSEAATELLSFLKLYVVDELKGIEADMLHDRMYDLTLALSSAPAQEDGSKELGAHPRAVPTSTWQDIATAERGLNAVLGYQATPGDWGGAMAICWPMGPVDRPPVWIGEGGLMPTHWVPLPEPPQALESSKPALADATNNPVPLTLSDAEEQA